MGLVVAVNRHTVDVLLPDGGILACRLQGRFRSEALRGAGVVVGDRAVVGPPPTLPAAGVVPPLRTLLGIEARTSVLRRHLTARTEARVGEDRTVAANVDLCLVVQAYREPAFRPAVADRLVAIARASSIPVALVLNKAEDAPEADVEVHLGPYRRLGIDAYAVSALTGLGLPRLEDRCAGALTVMLGPSGVGKSALTAALAAGEGPATGAVSDARLRRGRGRHTTVQSRVFPLRRGGFIIDTAGIRSLALPESATPVDAFPEIEQLALACRFPDCAHRSEPGCAVRAALAAGQLPARAYEGSQLLTRL